MNQYPKISVVIPNRNMGEQLERVLDAFLRQKYPSDHVEILVVDNGSTDNSQSIAGKYPVTLHLVPAPSNPYICRNVGIQHAQHDWILLSDSSCIPDADYLLELSKTQIQYNADVLVGNVQFEISGDSSLGEIVDSLHFMRNHEYLHVRKTFPACSLYFHKSVLDKIGLFQTDMRSGADFQWTRKVSDAAVEICYADTAKVTRRGVPFPHLLHKAHRLGWGHGTMARSQGKYTTLGTIWRMRPPGVRYLNYVLKTRGQGKYGSMWFRIWVGLWAFRISYNVGRLHIAQSFSD